ncbi:MAG: MalY/PatB family protein [Candidatus Bathyarchaeia archaeon]
MIRSEVFNSVTLGMMRGVKGSKWGLYGPDVIPMWLADPDFPVALEIKRALIEAVQDEDLFYAPDREAREAMAEKVKGRNGIEAEAGDIMMTQGVIPAMWLAVRYTCQPGDEVIVTDPMYGPFFTAVVVGEAKSLYHKLDEEEGYRFDIDTLNELVTKRTKLIFVCNPHNPCGRVLTEEELRGIGEVAVDHDLTIMSDELHEDIVFDGRKHISLASLSPEIEERTMTSFGFSKTYGVAGLQMGYLVATNKEMMKRLRAISRGIFRGTSTLAKAAAPVMLDDTLKWWREGLVKHLTMIRDLVEKRFEEMPGVTCPMLEGTYLMFPNISSYGKTSREITDYLLKEGKIAVSTGSQFGSNGEGHIRMCIATSESIINEALDRMERALSKLR